jgi:hypothetical protein
LTCPISCKMIHGWKKLNWIEFIEDHGHILRLPLYLWHLNPNKLVWSQAKIYYNRNISWVAFGMEVRKKYEKQNWNMFLGLFCLLITKQSFGVSRNIAKDCRHSSTNLFSQISGHSDSVEKLCVICRDSDEWQLGSRNLYRQSGSCNPIVKIPLREKTIQMAGQSHLNKHCEYYLFINFDCYSLQ